MKKINEMLTEDLQDKGFHVVNVKKLKRLANPFNAWCEIKKPITKKEIMQCLAENKEESVFTELVISIENKNKENIRKCRENHIKKIAYFVKHGFNAPILLDVGIPEIGAGFNVEHYIEDGNHRFAAAIIRQDETINCKISGSYNFMKELGLWNPNEYEIEYNKREDLE